MGNFTDQNVIREFRRRLTRRQIVFLTVFVPCVAAMVLLPQESVRPFVWPFIGFTFALGLLDYLTWRCLSCDKPLSSRRVDTSCAHCGAAFREK